MAKRITGINNDFRFDLTKMKDPAPINLVVSSTDKYQVKHRMYLVQKKL